MKCLCWCFKGRAKKENEEGKHVTKDDGTEDTRVEIQTEAKETIKTERSLRKRKTSISINIKYSVSLIGNVLYPEFLSVFHLFSKMLPVFFLFSN